MFRIFRFFPVSLLSGLFLLLFSQTKAFTETIDFEGLPDGTSITTQYPGLTFTNTTVIAAGISLNEFEFPPHSGTNVAFDDGGPISIDFSNPVNSFSGYFTYGEVLTIEAFNSADVLVSSVNSAFSNNEALSGDVGSSPDEFLQVNSASWISSITIAGDLAGGSLVMDDLTYLPATIVPEPNSLNLIFPGMLFVIILRLLTKTLMKRTLILGAFALLLVSGLGLYATGVFLGARSDSGSVAPNIPLPTAAPATVAVNSPTMITITVPLLDSSVIANSANLIRLTSDPKPATIVGSMHDDGENGDIAASDHIYSIRVPLTIKTPGPIQFEVSVAYKGIVKRVISPILSIQAYTSVPVLPPDPGSVGADTLLGIDSDHDGIRDDVQRYIALTYPNSQRVQAALTQMASAYLSMIQHSDDPNLSKAFGLEGIYGVECLSWATSTDLTALTQSLEAQVANTADRAKAYLKANYQQKQLFYTFSQNPSGRCQQDLSALSD